MAPFAKEECLYRHQKWEADGKVTALPYPPYRFYHYTPNDPAGFHGAVQPFGGSGASHWCSVKTDDRGCMSLATGIRIHDAGTPMWRIELTLNSVADATALGVLVGQARTTHRFSAYEYFIKQAVELSRCSFVAIP